MNYHEFNRHFKAVYPNYKEWDLTKRRTIWNELLDDMHRSGKVSDRCLDWSHPKFLKA